MSAKNLNRYLREWTLSDARLLAVTPTSTVYTVTHQGERAVLKLLTPLGVRDERSGAAALQMFGGNGAVRLLRHAENAHLLEYVEGEDLVALVERGEDTRATEILAAVVHQMHSSQEGPMPEGLIPLRRRFFCLFERARIERQRGHRTLFSRAEAVTDNLTRHPVNACALHGDLHHANVRHSARRGWLAFDPKGLYGERAFDVANALCNPVSLPALVRDEKRLRRSATIFAETLNIPVPRIMAYVFAYAALSACWHMQDGQNPIYALHMALLAEGCLNDT